MTKNLSNKQSSISEKKKPIISEENYINILSATLTILFIVIFVIDVLSNGDSTLAKDLFTMILPLSFTILGLYLLIYSINPLMKWSFDGALLNVDNDDEQIKNILSVVAGSVGSILLYMDIGKVLLSVVMILSFGIMGYMFTYILSTEPIVLTFVSVVLFFCLRFIFIIIRIMLMWIDLMFTTKFKPMEEYINSLNKNEDNKKDTDQNQTENKADSMDE